MLWAALRFPQLPIDRQSLTTTDEPLAVIEQTGPRRLIVACNNLAHELGIHPGLALNNAYALAPHLIVTEYDADEQAAHLKQLALWAMQFSSWVTPRAPDIVLVEINASLRLFGSLDKLLDKMRQGANHQRLVIQIGVAPTPAAAVLFTHAGITTPVIDKHTLPIALQDIPVQQLGLDEFTLKGLVQSGIRTLGKLRTMPAAALTRRFGHTCTTLLYRLDGTLPDPCPAFVAPSSFTEAVDLPLEAPDTNALRFPLNRLLCALGGYLCSHDQGVRSLDIHLSHHRVPPTIVNLSFLDATGDITHLFKVATERLANTAISEPVMRLRITATDIDTIDRASRDLLERSQAQRQNIEHVLDSLMARLGKHSVYTAMPGDDHRPEKAWMSALLHDQHLPENWPARPLWLLTTPQPAAEPLEMTTPAERIENGWWDTTDVRRDYYIARNRQGTHYWVYRLRHQSEPVYIHGIFA